MLYTILAQPGDAGKQEANMEAHKYTAVVDEALTCQVSWCAGRVACLQNVYRTVGRWTDGAVTHAGPINEGRGTGTLTARSRAAGLSRWLAICRMWLASTGTTGTLAANWLGGATHDVRKTGFNAGVVLEILLNGRYSDRHPLGDVADLKQLFRLMLDDGTKHMAPWAGPANVEDAPGMMRRVSD